jgi:integrase
MRTFRKSAGTLCTAPGEIPFLVTDFIYIACAAGRSAEQLSAAQNLLHFPALGQYRVLYALLAGSGLRIAEALGLEIGKHLSPDCSIVFVRQQRSKKGRGMEPFPKTDAGFRDVDLTPALAMLLKHYIGNRTSGFLFETSGGLPMSPRNIMRDSLHPILEGVGRRASTFSVDFVNPSCR